MSHRSFPRVAALLAAVVAIVVLTACGAPAGDGAGPEPQAPGAFPVTVEHAYGGTEVAAAPQRVITLGYTDPDSLLAVGVAPIGIVDWFVVPPPQNTWPWQQAGYAGAVPEVVGERDEYNLEQIARLQPDLIIASYSGMTRDQYEQVSRIAPTVAQPPGFAPFTAPWQVMTRHVTKAVGQERRGDELVRQTEARIAAVRDAHPEWRGQTAVAAAFTAPDYFAFSRGDIKADLLSALGFGAPPEIAQLAAGRSDARISPERVDLLDVDKLLVFARNPQVQAEISARPEFAALPVVQQRRTMFLFTSEQQAPVSAALGYGSVISFPYVLDRLVPMLEAMPAPPAR